MRSAGILLMGVMVLVLGMLSWTAPDRVRKVPVHRDMVIKPDNSKKMQRLLELIYGHDMTDFVTYSIPVTVTAYTATVEECNAEPWITANNTPSRIGIVAISQDLRVGMGLTFGDMIHLDGLGMFTIADLMSTHKRKNTSKQERITRTVDILHASKKAAKLFGVKKNIMMTYVR